MILVSQITFVFCKNCGQRFLIFNNFFWKSGGQLRFFVFFKKKSGACGLNGKTRQHSTYVTGF